MPEPYSVVIPAYNAADTIGDALRSIFEQSHPATEIIVVDDGSADATASVVKAFDPGITVICQQNRGCGAATNTGMSRVTTPLLAFLDADDVWLPEKAMVQAEIFESQKEISGLCSRAQTFRGPLSDAVFGNSFDLWGRSTMMIRTESALRTGEMIDPPGGRGDTVDWISRARDFGLRFEMLQQTLALRRIRPESLSFGRDAEKDRGYLFAVKRALDRKRCRPQEREAGPDE